MSDINLIELEQSLLDPAIRRNRAAVNALLDKDIFEFGSSGRHWNRQDTLDLLSSEPPAKILASDFCIHELAPETTLVTYKTNINGVVALRSSIWKRSQNEWKLFFHQGTKIP